MDNPFATVEPATLTVVPAGRFLTLPDVAEILNISQSQTYALVRNGDLSAIKIGGRGQWRVEETKLDAYIARMYEQTRAFIASQPFVEGETDVADATNGVTSERDGEGNAGATGHRTSDATDGDGVAATDHGRDGS